MENMEKFDIREVAWLYLLYIHKEMPISSWDKDNRMDGFNCDKSLKKFNCVNITDTHYIFTDECMSIMNEYFGVSSMKEIFMKEQEILNKGFQHKGYKFYSIHTIPNELYFRIHSKLKDNFDKIKDKITTHYNSMGCYDTIITKILKSRNIKEWNEYYFYKKFPNTNLNDTIILYRGLKSEYDPNKDTYYSCWTYKKEQAERFANYNFTGSYQFKPNYSEESYIIETEVNFKDISLIVSGVPDEGEIILKNPVNISNQYFLN